MSNRLSGVGPCGARERCLALRFGCAKAVLAIASSAFSCSHSSDESRPPAFCLPDRNLSRLAASIWSIRRTKMVGPMAAASPRYGHPTVCLCFAFLNKARTESAGAVDYVPMVVADHGWPGCQFCACWVLTGLEFIGDASLASNRRVFRRCHQLAVENLLFMLRCQRACCPASLHD